MSLDEDVLALIDDALYDENAGEYSSLGIVLRRARDEIVALRNAGVVRYSDGAKVLYGVTASRVRAEALEEAARACDEHADRPTVHNDTTDRMAHAVVQQSIAAISCAAAIRLLKDKRDE
jgi:hypothetical protein